MFNWRAAFACLCFAEMIVSTFMAIFAFDNGELRKSAAFIIMAMIFVFVFGGVIFA